MYQVGDHVVIKGKAEGSNRIVGKIEEIYEEDGNKKIKYNAYYFPEKTSAGRQDYNSKWEVYKTDEIEEAYYSDILNKCEILKFDTFVKKILSLKEKRVNFIEKNENIYFFRQKYLVSDDIFAPDLPNTCYCDDIFNPDKNFIQCKKCKEYLHVECFLTAESKKCFNAGCQNNIESQLSEVKKTEESNQVMIGNKRKREQEDKEESRESISNLHGKIQNVRSGELKIEPIAATTTNSNMQSTSDDKPTTDFFSNLSEAGRKYLRTLIENLEKKNNAINKPLNSDDKNRKTIREKIVSSLLYGIEEIKENKEWRRMKNQELNKEEIPEESAIRVSNTLAVAIETAIFLLFGEEISTNYKKKFMSLFSNLTDNRNHELRFAILNGDITPDELVKMTAEELAPSTLKERRLERQNKYFKEQVLINEDTKIIAKTHKGESILTVDMDQIVDPSDFFLGPTEVLSTTKQKAKEVNYTSKDNDSEKGSWDYGSEGEEAHNTNTNNIGEHEGREHKSKNQSSSSLNDLNLQLSTSNLSKLKSNSFIKYKKLSQDQVNFYNLLEEYKKENLLLKFNDKLKSTLKHSTYTEILTNRSEI